MKTIFKIQEVPKAQFTFAFHLPGVGKENAKVFTCKPSERHPPPGDGENWSVLLCCFFNTTSKLTLEISPRKEIGNRARPRLRLCENKTAGKRIFDSHFLGIDIAAISVYDTIGRVILNKQMSFHPQRWY